MITADDDYYATLMLAHDILNVNVASTPIERELATALLDVEERRQLALGELGEVVMKDGPASHWHAQRTADILAGRVAV